MIDDMSSEKAAYRPRMKPNTPGKLNYGRTFLIGLAFFTTSFAWSYYNFQLPILLGEYLERDLGLTRTDTIVGFIMVIDNIFAIVLLPVFGSLSDRVQSKYGKRMPFLIIGVLSAMIAFAAMGFISQYSGVGVFAGLISIIVWFNLSMAFYRSPAVALMPDLTDPEVRSTGNAIINLMGAVGMVLALGGRSLIPLIIGEGALARAVTFYYISIVSLIAFVILFIKIKETPTGDGFFKIGPKSIAIDPVTLEYDSEKEAEQREPILDSLRTVFFEKEKSALNMLFVIFFFFFGYNAIDTFYSKYATEYLGWAEGAASTALLIAPATMVLTAIFAGKIAEKIGRRITVMIGLVGLTLTIVAIIFISNPTIMMIMFGVVGIFYGLININTIVIIWELAPKSKIGSYTGVYYFFSQLSATLSPVVAGGVFDLYGIITNAPDGQQYIMLFPYVILFEIIGALILLRVKRGEAPSMSKQQIDDLRDKYGDDD